MDLSSISTVAGIASTVIFASSMLPMLVKARRTLDLASYSLGNILLSNVGNIVHSVYVFSLPPGPIWALHSFYLLSTALMLVWFVQSAHGGAAGGVHRSTHARTEADTCCARRGLRHPGPSVDGDQLPGGVR